MPALLYRTKLPHPDDSDIVQTITEAVTKGHPLATAAARAGIHEDTLYHWLNTGRAEIQATDGAWTPWTELSSHAQLVIRIKEALSGLVEEALDHVRAGGKDWAAWMTLLERRMPKEFGRNRDEAPPPPGATFNFYGALPPGAAEALLTMGQAEQDRATKFLPPGGGGSDSAGSDSD